MGADPVRPWLPPPLAEEEWFERLMLELPDDEWKAFWRTVKEDEVRRLGYFVTGDPEVDEMNRRLAAGGG